MLCAKYLCSSWESFTGQVIRPTLLYRVGVWGSQAEPGTEAADHGNAHASVYE